MSFNPRISRDHAAHANSYGGDESAIVPVGARDLVTVLHVVSMLLMVLLAWATFALRLYEPGNSHETVTVMSALAVMGLVAYVRYVLNLRWLSASIVYLMLFWMFHYGQSFTAVVSPDVLDWAPLADWRSSWLFWPNVRVAMLLGVIGAAGFVLGLGLVTGRAAAPPRHCSEEYADRGLFYVGWVLLLIGLAGSVFTLVRSGGVDVFALGYSQFRQGVLEPAGIAIDLASLGCLLALCGTTRQRWWPALALWTPLAIVLLLAGSRQEAMIPLVAFVLVLTYRGVRFPRGLLVTGILVALLAIPAIKTFRSVGFSNRASVGWTEVSPLFALAELGGTLRAAKAYVDWIEDGDPYLLGASYWAPFDRQVLARLLPFRERLPVSDDERVPQRHIWREGAVGLSATGEAYYNFGPLGPLLFFGCVGVLFGWLETSASASPYRCALLGMVMFLFFFNIRGAWLPVPARLGFGICILAGCYFVRLWLTRRHSNSALI